MIYISDFGQRYIHHVCGNTTFRSYLQHCWHTFLLVSLFFLLWLTIAIPMTSIPDKIFHALRPYPKIQFIYSCWSFPILLLIGLTLLMWLLIVIFNPCPCPLLYHYSKSNMQYDFIHFSLNHDTQKSYLDDNTYHYNESLLSHYMFCDYSNDMIFGFETLGIKHYISAKIYQYLHMFLNN